MELITMLCRLKKDHKPHLSQTDEIIQNITKHICDNYNTSLSLDSLSTQFGLSKGYLSRQFKIITGLGLNEYITHIRITNAEKMLKENKYPITYIATLCGFNDSNYFAAVFKKLKGVTPYKFSKQNRK